MTAQKRSKKRTALPFLAILAGLCLLPAAVCSAIFALLPSPPMKAPQLQEVGQVMLYDINQPRIPDADGIVPARQNIWQMVSQDEVVYLLDNRQQIHLVDVSRPEQPQLLNSLFIEGRTQNFTVQNGIIFAGNETGLLSYDASDPAQIGPLGSFADGSSSRAMAVDGHYLYLVRGNTLYAIDISNPAEMSLAGSYPFPTPTQFGTDHVVLAARDGIVYLFVTDDVLRILDWRDPANPAEMASLATDKSKRHYEMVLLANVLYMVIDSGVLQIDVSDPARPERIRLNRATYILPDGMGVNDDYIVVYDDGSLVTFSQDSPGALQMLLGTRTEPEDGSFISHLTAGKQVFYVVIDGDFLVMEPE